MRIQLLNTKKIPDFFPPNFRAPYYPTQGAGRHRGAGGKGLWVHLNEIPISPIKTVAARPEAPGTPPCRIGFFEIPTKFRPAYKQTQLCCWVGVCFRKVAPQIRKVNPSALPLKLRATQIGPRCIRIPPEVHSPLTYLPTIQLSKLLFLFF